MLEILSHRAGTCRKPPAGFTLTDLQPDGSFSGAYSDSNMGESSDANPHGTVYYCNFNGQFTQPQPVTEYCYSVELTEFSAEDSENAEYIDNGIRYVRSEPYATVDAEARECFISGTGGFTDTIRAKPVSFSHLSQA